MQHGKDLRRELTKETKDQSARENEGGPIVFYSKVFQNIGSNPFSFLFVIVFLFHHS